MGRTNRFDEARCIYTRELFSMKGQFDRLGQNSDRLQKVEEGFVKIANVLQAHRPVISSVVER